MISDLQSDNDIPELGELIRATMTRQRISLNKLAEAAGVGVATISNLLEQGTDKAQSGVHPLVLRKVAEVLQLDQVMLFQVAGYIVAQGIPQPLSVEATYLATCFDSLSTEQQNLLIDMAHSLMTSAGIPLRGVRVRELLKRANLLRDKHPVFRDQPFGVRRELGRFLGNLTRTTTYEILIRGVIGRVNDALAVDTPPRSVEQTYIENILQHPDVGIILNDLLPRKEIPMSLEKLYWLVHDSRTAGQHLRDLPERYKPYKEAIRDLWKLLEWAAGETETPE